MVQALSEHRVQRLLGRYLSRRNRVVRTEFPFLSRIIDLAWYDQATDEVTAVEIKLRHYDRLVQQVRACRHFADRVYVAVPKASIQLVKAKASLPDDVGIISFNAKGSELSFQEERSPALSPAKNELLSANAKSVLLHWKAIASR